MAWKLLLKCLVVISGSVFLCALLLLYSLTPLNSEETVQKKILNFVGHEQKHRYSPEIQRVIDQLYGKTIYFYIYDDLPPEVNTELRERKVCGLPANHL